MWLVKPLNPCRHSGQGRSFLNGFFSLGCLTSIVFGSPIGGLGHPAPHQTNPNSGWRQSALETQEKQLKEYPLPAEADSIVLSLEYGGGLPMPQQPKFTPTPQVRVQADGRVITGGSSPKAPIVELQLSPNELQELLREIIETDRLLEIKPGEIDKAIKETGQRIMIADAPTTTLTVRLADREVQLRQYASRMIRRQYLEVESLQRFVSSENRLKRLQGMALLGGRTAMLELLAAVNEAVGAKSAELPPMDPESLEFVNRDGKGGISASWVKQVVIDGQQMAYTVRIDIDEKGNRQIDVGDLHQAIR